MTQRFPEPVRRAALSITVVCIVLGLIAARFSVSIGALAFLVFLLTGGGAAVGLGIWLARVEQHALGLTVKNIRGSHFVRWEEADSFETAETFWGTAPAVRTAAGKLIPISVLAERGEGAAERAEQAILRLKKYRDAVRKRWSD